MIDTDIHASQSDAGIIFYEENTNFSNSFFIKRIVFFRKVIQMILSVSTVVTVDVNIFSPNQSL